MTRLVIAVDGPAASGKGTVAARLAAHYGLPHLDTGTLYRGSARKALLAIKEATGKDVIDATERKHVELAVDAACSLVMSDLSAPDLGSEHIAQAASIVSAIADVRAALIDYQRNFAAQGKGAVIDGRDIGTVICPSATIKFFITASPRIRAERRFLQQQQIDPKAKYETTLADINARDTRDTGRKIAPLIAAKDAIHIDTSAMNADQVFEAALKHVEKRVK